MLFITAYRKGQNMTCKRCHGKGYLKFSFNDRHGHFKDIFTSCPDCDIENPSKFCVECDALLVFDEELETGFCDPCYKKKMNAELEENRILQQKIR